MGLPYRSDDEVRQWMSRDPNVRFKTWLVAKGLATESELAKVEKDAQGAVERSIAFARQSQCPDPKAGVLNTHANVAVAATSFQTGPTIHLARRIHMSKKSYSFAQLEAVAQEMRKNPDMVFFYEYETPIATLPTGEILDLVKEFGTHRTSGRGWAIDESWIVGTAIGAATAGSSAIARIPSMATIYAIEYVYNQAGKLRSMTGGQVSMPFVLWQGGGSRSRGRQDSTRRSDGGALRKPAGDQGRGSQRRLRRKGSDGCRDPRS
jgi:hypothetical protein